MNTIEDALKSQVTLDSETASLDVELILGHVLNRDRSYLRTWPDKPLSNQELNEFKLLLKRRQSGEPIAYIIGSQSFWTLDLLVSPGTLIPRPDTEVLVEQALSLTLPMEAKVLDLGTGTGAIALALASEKPQWKVSAVDYSEDVVLLAQKNAERHGLSKVNIFQSNWFESVPSELFDLIVSNPPYIDEADAHLNQGDVRFEPKSALVAEREGLADIEHIADNARTWLGKAGWLIVEHGYDQGASVRSLFNRLGYQQVSSCVDLGANERITMGQYDGGGQ